MAFTRGQMIDRIVAILGETSTSFRDFITGSFNQILFALWDSHDWEFKHKSGAITLTPGVEFYDFSIPTPDIRSAQDIEVLYDTTVGYVYNKVDLKDIRKEDPQGTQNQDPIVYAPWGTKDVYVYPKPIQANALKYLYLSKPILPTSDDDDLETVCGIPDYCQYLLEKMVLAEGYLYYDESRRVALLDEINRIWLPNARNADMKHLESGARFKFWEEELAPSSTTFNDFLRRAWWGNDFY